MVPVNTIRSGAWRLMDGCLFSRFSISAASLRISPRRCQYTLGEKANLSMSSVSRLGRAELCRLGPLSHSTGRGDRGLTCSTKPSSLGGGCPTMVGVSSLFVPAARGWYSDGWRVSIAPGGENQAQFAKTRTFKSTLPVAITQRIWTSCVGPLEAPFAGTPFWLSAAPLVPESFTIPGAHRMHDTK